MRSRPSSASTSARRRPRWTPTSGRRPRGYSSVWRRLRRTAGAARAARDALLGRRRDARGGGRAPGRRARLRACRGRGRGSARRAARGVERDLARHGRDVDGRLPDRRRGGGCGERTPVGGLPVRLPTVDLQTVGAGGGSIVWLDAGGALRVGPRAPAPIRARPATAAAGRSRRSRTPTPARPAARAARGRPGARSRRRGAALRRIDPAAVVEVVNAEMLRALRVVSVERGHDPRDFALVAFGGAGPLHACALAEELEIGTVLVPGGGGRAVRPRTGRERRAPRPRRVVRRPLDGARDLPAEGEADLRYLGQSFELTVPLGATSPSVPPSARGAVRLCGSCGRSSSLPYGPPTSAPPELRAAPGTAARDDRPRVRRARGLQRAGVPRGGWGLGMVPHCGLTRT